MKGRGYITTGFKRYFAYKAQVFARILSSPIELIIMMLIWNSIFNYSSLERVGGFTLQEMINYYIIIWIMTAIVSDYTDDRLGWNIYNGMLNTRLLKPLKIHWLFLYDSIGEKFGSLLIQVIPFTVISIIFLGFTSSGILNTLIATASFILAFLIYFFFNMLFGLVAFKLKAYRYMSRIKRIFINFTSGKLIPLTVFPLSIAGIINYLPFSYIYSAPANIFLGKYTIQASLLTLLIQTVWIVLLYALFRIGWFKALKNFEGVGT